MNNIKINKIRELCVDIELVKGGYVEGMNVKEMMEEMENGSRELDRELSWDEWSEWSNEWREMKREWSKGNYNYMIERV